MLSTKFKSIIRSTHKTFCHSIYITLMLMLHQTASYTLYLCGCKVTSQITWCVVTIKQLFSNLITGSNPLIEMNSLS